MTAATNIKNIFTARDLDLLRRKAQLRAELAEVEAELKPKIQNVVNKCGVGSYDLYGATLTFKQQTRISTKWKGICEKLCTPEQIEEVFDEFSTASKNYSVSEELGTEE